MKRRKEKNMKKSLIWISSVIGVGAVLALLFGILDRPSELKTISVSGECLTTVPKDRTAITLRVTTLDKDAAVSMKQATEKVAQITSFLKTLNVQMQTTDLKKKKKSEWNRELEKSVVLGIETTIAVEVSADNIETIEKVLTAFAGQENVYSENLRMFTSAETMKPALEKCLSIAVENARERANALAQGDNRTAGKLLSVSYNSGSASTYQPRAANFLATSAKMAVAESSVYVGGSLVGKDTEVSVQVSAVFEIK